MLYMILLWTKEADEGVIMNIFDNAKKTKFHPIDNKGIFKTLIGQITFDERIVALDTINDQTYITTETKMYRLEYKGSEPEPKPVRIW